MRNVLRAVPAVVAATLVFCCPASPGPRQTPNAQTAFSPKPVTDASGVMYFSGDQVSQAIPKGGVFYSGERNYRVTIYHRDAAGEVEIHAKDTDIFYIMEGAATFATGGAIKGGKQTAPDETRGPSMDGGTVRKVSKGDILIIPAGVTHWFKEIHQPISYLGVKVR
jgi:quercetin dioxygenase-like cupin family protein